MSLLGRCAWLSFALISFAAYVAVVPFVYELSRPPVATEMEVTIPRFAQVIMAAGDRYLAADLAGFRALVVSTERMDAENYRILGLVQSDIAWFNPAHEDNYYIAAAILPWYGEVEASQYILQRASVARPFDWQPAFYYAFNAYHFLKDPQEGAKWMRIAATQTDDEIEKIQLQQVAAQWVGKSDDLEMAIRIHRAMAKESHDKGFANFLEKRAVRLENQLLIQRAINRFVKLTGRKPSQIHELIDLYVLPVIPVDPFGMEYVFDANGAPQAAQTKISAQGAIR